MALFNDFPYTNLHELNLEWIIKQIRQLRDDFGDKADEMIAELIRDYFLRITYDPENERINLVVTDGTTPAPTDNGHEVDEFNVGGDLVHVKDSTAREAIDEIEDRLDGLTDSLAGVKCLLIGNSYARGTGGTIGKGWPYYFQELTSCDATIIQQAGGDFGALGNANADYPGANYAGALQQFSQGLTQDQRDAYRFIVFGGGFNDTSSTANPGGVDAAQAGLNEVAALIRERFPRARVVLVPMYSEQQANAPAIMQVYAMFARTAAMHGWMTTTHSWLWFTGQTDYAAGDGIHLNDSGYRRAGRFAAAVVMGWDGIYSNAFSITTEVGVSGTVRGRVVGGDVVMRMQINVANSVYNSENKHVKIMSINRPYATPGVTIYLPCMYFNTSDNTIRAAGFLEFRGSGDVYTVNLSQVAPEVGGSDTTIYFFGQYPNYLG